MAFILVISPKPTLKNLLPAATFGQKRTLKGEATPNAGGEHRAEKPEQVSLGAQDDRWL